jgi:hypothetical protein
MVDILSRPRVERTRHGGNDYSRLSASRQDTWLRPRCHKHLKRPPGLFLLVDRSTTPALRSLCSHADRLMRSERNIRCSSRICLRAGWATEFVWSAGRDLGQAASNSCRLQGRRPPSCGFFGFANQSGYAAAWNGSLQVAIACTGVNGAPDTVRTCGLCLRRATHYPAELRVPNSQP